MHRSMLLLSACAVLLSACADGPSKRYGGAPGADPTQPAVNIVEGEIAVGLDPLVFKLGPPIDITWTLSDPAYHFPAETGIVLLGLVTKSALGSKIDPTQGKDEIRCGRGSDAQTFVCRNQRSKVGTYAYELNVLDPNGKTITLDPTIMNK